MDKIKLELQKEKDRMLDYFIKEIKRQCEYSFISLKNLEDSIKNKETGAQIVFYNLHNLFTNLGNISKILYPSKQYRSRGRDLREILQIKEDSQFDSRKERNVLRNYRNIIEHYDEYFEDWYKKGDNSNIIDSTVGPDNMIVINGKKPKYLRHFNPYEFKFIHLDREYKMQEVINETYAIYNKILELKEGNMIAITRE